MAFSDKHPAFLIVTLFCLGAGGGFAVGWNLSNSEISSLKSQVDTLKLAGVDGLPATLAELKEVSKAIKKV
jgi:hypothetical protein